MDTSTLVETNIYAVAVVGAIGVIIGALITVFGNVTIRFLQNRSKNKLDEKRKNFLLKCLTVNDFPKNGENLKLFLELLELMTKLQKGCLLRLGQEVLKQKVIVGG